MLRTSGSKQIHHRPLQYVCLHTQRPRSSPPPPRRRRGSPTGPARPSTGRASRSGLADDALFIVVLDSTTSDESRTRIVLAFEAGSVVTSTRYDVDYVVTEHGVARLNGATTRERALGLTSVAHPKFRDELESAAKKMGLV